jgi:hypothetical protein
VSSTRSQDTDGQRSGSTKITPSRPGSKTARPEVRKQIPPRDDPSHAGASTSGARARTVHPRSRTSHRWQARTRDSPRAPRNPGTPLSPRASMLLVRGRRDPGQLPCSWPLTATPVTVGRTVKQCPPLRPPLATPWHRCNYNRVIIPDRHAWRKGNSRNNTFSTTQRACDALTLSSEESGTAEQVAGFSAASSPHAGSRTGTPRPGV